MHIHDITIYKGYSFGLDFIWENGGNLEDLSLWTGLLQIRATIQSETSLVEVSTDSGDIILGDLGSVTIEIPETITGTLPTINGCWSFVIKDTLGNKYPPIIGGRVYIIPSATQWG